MFYFTLQNVPQKYRAKLDNIFIVGLARKEDIREFGVETLLDNFLATMHQLAVGIPIQLTPNLNFSFFGFLVGLLADTPASHYILGFKEGVGGAFRACRDCFGTIIDRQFLVSFRHLPLWRFFPLSCLRTTIVSREPVRCQDSYSSSCPCRAAKQPQWGSQGCFLCSGL